MNSAINRLYLGLLLLFALLVGFTSNWAVFDADELEANAHNRRPLLEAQQIERGKIESSDGELIAESIKKGKGEQLRYERRYPLGELFGHPIGYSFITQGQKAFELAENDTLTGEGNEFESILEQLQGQTEEGSSIVTTLDASAQRIAMDQLAGQPTPGAVVAIEPQTGAVRVMASTPGYDPNAIPDDITELNQQEPGPLLNRALQNPYAPGSTMKVVTAAAALDSGEFTPETVLDGSTPQTFSGVPLSNAGGEQFGDINMQFALTHSVNTYFAQVGESIGSETLLDYMRRFGFEEDPDLDFPDGEMVASGVYRNGKIVDSDFDVARVAIGQGGAEGEVLATPFQMAQVAATVANGGVPMKPQLVQEVKDPDGRVTDELDPDELDRAVSEETAAQLASMMTDVVNEGTASNLSLGGTTFAGKTGTAELDIEADTARPWFIAFAPVEDPQIAVAAMIEQCTSCFGGTTAGPIATAVMQDLLG